MFDMSHLMSLYASSTRPDSSLISKNLPNFRVHDDAVSLEAASKVQEAKLG